MMMEMPVAWMPPDHRDRVVDLGRVEPGQRLVEQQHHRLGRDRPRHLQQLALVQVERVGPGVGQVSKVDGRQVLLGPPPGLRPARRRYGRT